MAEEDSFDIDGEGEGEDADYYDDDEHTFTVEEPQPDPQPIKRFDSNTISRIDSDTVSRSTSIKQEGNASPSDALRSTPMQGVKRKGPTSDRPIDSGATTALMVSDLHWWITEDDIRGWINEAEAEDDLKELTFSEHKVNGKSKGQVYLDFATPQASTAAKHRIQDPTEGPNSTRKFSVAFTSASYNPFQTTPKDAPARAKEERTSRGGSSAYNMGRGDYSDRGSGFRGRGRGYDRGGYNNQNYNRNFSGPSGSFNNGGGFQGNMGTMNNFNFNRGGVMGNNMRGNMGGMCSGRGGINNMMPMGGIGMGNMAMNPMMAGMGMPGFSGNQFGAMFNQGTFGGDWNQPGTKRQRQE